MKIFCDLDGTLIDVSPRHYRVYAEITNSLNGKPLDKSTYWKLKRQKAKWPEILTLSRLSPDLETDFLAEFIKKIEDPQYLEMDILFDGSLTALDELARAHELYLVSLRRNRQNLLGEIERLKLAQHFTAVLTGHSESDGYDVKVELIKKELGESQGAIVGDTEADIITGKELGLATIAVTSGIRDQKYLLGLEPDHIVKNISEAAGILEVN